MKSHKYLLFVGMTLGLLTLSATEFDGFYLWRNGVFTKFDLTEMSFEDNKITLGNATFSVSDVDSITFRKPDETAGILTDTVYVNFDGQQATVVPENVVGITCEVDGANLTLTNDNTDREMTFVLSGESAQGSFTYNGEYKACIQLNGVTLNNANGPAINIQDGKRISVSVQKGAASTLTDIWHEQCRVDDQELDVVITTGKMVYPVTDRFIVEWEEMKAVYPKAVNLGSIF